mmetsp:Transcript_2502/g.6546  ORF Transcript_2502/g.6546 Transcript_2502/m.6546 type:complete len:215 (-) Transcript_2502:338-982(-)
MERLRYAARRLHALEQPVRVPTRRDRPERAVVAREREEMEPSVRAAGGGNVQAGRRRAPHIHIGSFHGRQRRRGGERFAPLLLVQHVPQDAERVAPLGDEPIRVFVHTVGEARERRGRDRAGARSSDRLDRREGGVGRRARSAESPPSANRSVRSRRRRRIAAPSEEGGRAAQVVREEVPRAAKGEGDEASRRAGRSFCRVQHHDLHRPRRLQK